MPKRSSNLVTSPPEEEAEVLRGRRSPAADTPLPKGPPGRGQLLNSQLEVLHLGIRFGVGAEGLARD